ncbi:glyoxalase [Lentilactobacillus fungorum]|uniref:Glyoxalase n=1 Tax=Lentilactobacillus fungorum TaxID=2201250 RepID=A0ABQ3VZG1_9LACO|nr:VOC family protein [Lentilactobacillus fungorum]GHP13406.1 glyoxalase [Lentilactobacillus fungorum]
MEYYPMALFPKLMVQDIEKSSKWYEISLGFKSLFKFRNRKNEVILNHLRLNKYQDIMLIQGTDFTVGTGVYLNLLVDDALEKLKHVSPKAIVEPLSEKPWNASEATIKDPDGYLITLTQPHIDKKDFDNLMKDTKKTFK